LGGTLTTLSLKGLKWSKGVPKSHAPVSARNVLTAAISAPELSQLSSHDVVLMIDTSRSMLKTDCSPVAPEPQADLSKSEDHSYPRVSRWQWCHDQTLDFREKTQGAIPSGITVVLFARDCSVYNNVDAKAIETIFSDCTPNGCTNTSAALESQLDQYFERKGRIGQEAKPLLIAVITDGCPDDPSKLRHAIIDATRRMTTRDEISITFLQVGKDSDGSKILTGLDRDLVDHKAQYDIVNLIPFTEVRKIGLARALVNAVAKR
jgi:hypothetical protein